MSEIPGRIINLAKSYVDVARSRIQSIDEAAIAELQRALAGTDMAAVDPNAEYKPVSDDPMARAASKIAAAKARADVGSLDTQSSAPTPAVRSTETQTVAEQISALEKSASPSQQAAATPTSTAYRIIGLPDGADRATVEDTVRKFRERCAPERFAEGSPERAEAMRILARIDEAFALLMQNFNVGVSRFDKLEL